MSLEGKIGLRLSEINLGQNSPLVIKKGPPNLKRAQLQFKFKKIVAETEKTVQRHDVDSSDMSSFGRSTPLIRNSGKTLIAEESKTI